MSTWRAIYANDAGIELAIPVVEQNGEFYLETELGQLKPFDLTINDKNLGTLKRTRMEEVPSLPPQPRDPARQALLARLNELLLRLPNYELCLNRCPSIRGAVDKRFAGLSTEDIEQLGFLVENETERQAKEKKASEPPPVFTRDQLRLSFRGQTIPTNLFIEEPHTFGSDANKWSGEWLGRCLNCGTRYRITSQLIWQIKTGYSEPFRCKCKEKK